MMLERIAREMRLDHLAVEISRQLTAADVSHAVIKGPTTARWLYPEGERTYRDVDVLVPFSRAERAARSLIAAGIARSLRPAVGESAPHSVNLVSTFGAEIDLHVDLPANPRVTRDDQVWQALSRHVQEFHLDGGPVPALDVPARVVILAMHVVNSGWSLEYVREDLRRCLARISAAELGAAQELARELGLSQHLEAATAFTEGGDVSGFADDIRLRLSGAPAPFVQWERLRRLPTGRRIRALARELIPSRGFMYHAHPGMEPTVWGLGGAYVRRVYRLSRLVVHGWRMQASR